MLDGRSKVTTASLDDAEKIYKSIDRKLARLRAMLDDIENSSKTEVNMQYWNSGLEADKKLDVFVRGIEAEDY